MKPVFADTCYFLALFNPDDAGHLTGDHHFEQAGFRALLT